MNKQTVRPDSARAVLTGQRSALAGMTPGQTRVLRVSLALVAAGVLAQIAYPLLSGSALRAATIVSVVLLAAASMAHAGAVWGRRGALIVPAVAGGIGLVAETIGVHTGFPFGSYAYADTLGPRLLAVPLIVPLAWTMLAYPCLLLGRRLARHLTGAGPDARVPGRLLTAVTGGVGLTGWDLFLDPQMVAQGHWTWANPVPALPGVPGVPLTNYAGWLLVSVLMIAVLDHQLPRHRLGADHRNGSAVAVLAWTWCGSAVGNLVFFDRPWVALYGGLVMGVVVLPYLLLIRGDAVSNTQQGARETVVQPRTEDIR